MIQYDRDKMSEATTRRLVASEGSIDDTIIVKKDIPIFVMEIGDPFNVVGMISEYRKQNGAHYPSNVKAWRSSFLTHQETDMFDDVITFLVDTCDKKIAEHYGVFVKHQCIQMWVMEYEKGNWAAKHTHYPTDWSAVYYAGMDDQSAPVIVENSIRINPKSGTLVLFPGILDHKVPATASQRKVLAMNLMKMDVG